MSALFGNDTEYGPDGEVKVFGARRALVTSNQDPDGLGRVKLRYPWLGETVESGWVRIISPMAGKERGLLCLPDVEEEVLVMFENGDLNVPYVLGGLWNQSDLPPGKNDDGKNNIKLLKSRCGHSIVLDDSEGAAKITIADGSGKNRIEIDTQSGTIRLSAEKSLSIQCDGDLTLTAKGKLVLSGGDLQIQAQQAGSLQAGQTLDLQAQGGMSLRSAPGIKFNDGALEVI